MTARMRQEEKRAAATPILKAAVLEGKNMRDAAALAHVSPNTAESYRRRAEEVEGPWSLQLDGLIAEGDVPCVQEVADLLGRQTKKLAKRELDAESDTLVKYADSLSKVSSTYLGLLSLIQKTKEWEQTRLEKAQDRANDPESVLRGTAGFMQWLRREAEATRLDEPTVTRITEVYTRYTEDLTSGRFEIAP